MAERITAVPLDVRTARACAARLEERAELLRKCHERRGWGPKHHFLDRAAELERMAEVLRTVPTLHETERRSVSASKAFAAVVTGPKKKGGAK